jgi:hypothetical protein
MSGELHDNLHSNCLQQPCKTTQPIERSHFFRPAVLFCSNLHASLVTPGSTRRGKRNGKVNVEDRVMDAPDTACRCSPMSLHAITHLRDVEDDEENQEDCAEEVTAKQRRLRMGVSDEWDSESGKESVGAVSLDEEVEYGQG